MFLSIVIFGYNVIDDDWNIMSISNSKNDEFTGSPDLNKNFFENLTSSIESIMLAQNASINN